MVEKKDIASERSAVAVAGAGETTKFGSACKRRGTSGLGASGDASWARRSAAKLASVAGVPESSVAAQAGIAAEGDKLLAAVVDAAPSEQSDHLLDLVDVYPCRVDLVGSPRK